MRFARAVCLALSAGLALTACSAAGQQAKSSTSPLSAGTLTCGPSSTRDCTSTGKVRWSRVLDGKYVFKKNFILPADTHPDGTFPDAASTRHSIVYVEGDRAMAINRTSGRVMWHTTIGSRDGRLKYDPVVFAGDGLVAVRLEVDDPRNDSTHLWVLDAETGEPVSDLALPGSSYYVQAIVDGTVSLMGETVVIGIDARTGKKKWEVSLAPWSGTTVAGGVLYADDNSAEPARNGVMRRIQRVDLKSGKRLPELKLPENLRVAGRLQRFHLRDVVYVTTFGKAGEKGRLVALNGGNGHELWSTPIRSGPHSYFLDFDRAYDPPLLYWRSGKKVRARDARTGSVVAKPRPYKRFAGWGVLGGATVREIDVDEDMPGAHLEGHSTRNGTVRWRGPEMVAYSKIASRERGSPRLIVGLACAPDGVRQPASGAPSSNERCVKPRLFAING